MRCAAARELGRTHSEQAIEPLISALTSEKDRFVRWYAAGALGRIGSGRAVGPLGRVLTTDGDSFVRGFAARALGNIGDELAIKPLKGALADEGEYGPERVKDEAFAALGRISRRNGIRITLHGGRA